MGQCKWAILCALVATAVAGRLFGQESPSAPAPGEAERRIERVLAEPLETQLDFIDAPLNSILQLLAEEYQIPILFDASALEEVGQTPDTEVSISIRGVTLGSALELILRNAGDLTYLVADEVLLITTHDVAESHLEVRVYRVDDLVDDSVIGADEFAPIIDVVVSTVESDSWSINGRGEGEINAFRPGALVVTQSRRVHEQVHELLERLRAVRAEVLADAPADDDDGQIITRGIRIADDSLAKNDAARNAVLTVLTRTADWESDDPSIAEQVMLDIIPGRVVVRHRPDVVRQVVRALRDLSLLAPQTAEDAHDDGSPRGGFF